MGLGLGFGSGVGVGVGVRHALDDMLADRVGLEGRRWLRLVRGRGQELGLGLGLG